MKLLQGIVQRAVYLEIPLWTSRGPHPRSLSTLRKDDRQESKAEYCRFPPADTCFKSKSQCEPGRVGSSGLVARCGAARFRDVSTAPQSSVGIIEHGH